ncbi:MAG: tetratricopeptide repeat protein [Chitinophagales bacterium]|nr:tetratricopeptide repeat protein [Chitinophagales bacterium]
MNKTGNTSNQKNFYDLLPLQWLVLAAAVLVIYFPTINYQLTQYDDAFFTESSAKWLKQSGNISDAFTQGVFSDPASKSDSYYRPMLLLTFYFDEWIGGSSLKAFHITNIIIHLLNVLLVLLLFRKLKFSSPVSFWMAMFFAIHPALQQAVSWIPGRNDSLMTLFALCSIVSLLEYRTRAGLGFLAAHIVSFALALLTKETAVLLPLLFVIIWLLPANSSQTNSIYRIFIPSWVILIAAFFVLRKSVLGSTVGLPFAYTVQNFLENVPALLLYAGKMLLPFNLSTLPTLKDDTLIFGILTVIMTIAAVWFTKNKTRLLLLLACTWWVVFLLPAILRISVNYESVFPEHRLYFPLIGFLLLWAQTDAVKKGITAPGISFITIPIIVVLFSIFTFIHRPEYMNEEKYWTSAVTHSPGSSFARRALGNYYVSKGLFPDAQLQYATALMLNPELPEVRNNLGRLALNRAEFEIAEKYFRQEIARYPNSFTAYYNLGLVKMNQKQFDSAEFYVRKSISINPGYFDSKNDLSVILAMEGRFEEALLQSIALLEENPEYYPAKKNVKLILNVWNDPEKVSYYRDLLKQKGITY